MAHDESGSLAASLPPAIQALASGKRSEPGPTERAAAYAFGVTQRADQPGWWGGDVWEHVRNYKGAVALAIEPYIKFFLGADYRAYRKRKSVRKSLANGFSKFARDDEYEPLDDDHPVSQILKHPGGEDGAWTIGFEMAFAYLQYAITGQAPIWTPLNRDGKPCQLYALVAAGITSAYPPGSPSYPQGAYRVTPISSYGWTTSAQLNIPAVLPAEEVRVLKKVHPLGRHLGMSPLQIGAKNVDLFNAIIDFQWNYFNEGVALDVVVSAPGADEATCQRIKENLTQKHGGARKARSLAVWGGGYGGEPGKGVSVSNLAPAAKDLDFPNGRTTALQELMAFFGTPKILAGYTEDSNYATYIGQVRMFRDMHLRPAFEIVSDFLSKHVAQAWAEDGEELVVACEPQIPRDEEADARELQFAVGQGLVTVNEYRKATGRDAVEDGDLPASAYQQKVQQSIAPPPMPGMDPNAMPGAEQAAPVPGADGQPDPTGNPSGNPGEFPDDEQGTQDATLQAALAALGMGDAPEGEPVQKAAVPVNKPGGARKVRQEGETWTGGDGKRWTKKGGRIVPAPAQGGSGTGGPVASASRPAGQSAPAPAQPQRPGSSAIPRTEAGEIKDAFGNLGGGIRGSLNDSVRESLAKTGDVPQTERRAKTLIAQAFDLAVKEYGNNPDTHKRFMEALEGMNDHTPHGWMTALNGAFKDAKKPTQSGSGAGGQQPDRTQLHAEILKKAGKGAKAFGLTPEILAKMPPAAVDTIAAQLGISKPEQHYAQHAAAVPVTPQSKTHLERAHEWADSMAQKHAARVAQHLGVRPELAQKILSKAIRQVAEHALKNGGRASGTLSVGGKNLRVGVGKPGDAASAKPAQSKPPTPQQVGLTGGARDGAGKRPVAGAGSPSRPRPQPVTDSEQATSGEQPQRRPGLLSRLANSRAGRLVGRAGSAYADLVDRGVIAFGTDEERTDARERRADRKVRKAMPDEFDLLAELRAEGEDEIADALEQAAVAVESGDEDVFTKAMNTLSDPDGGFLVEPAAVPVRKKRRKRPVCEIVRKALQGVTA